MKLLLPDAAPFSLTVPPEVTVVTYEASRPVPPEHLDAEALVVWGSSRDDIAAVARRMPHLRWVQTLAAGSESVVAANFPDDVILTSGSGLHDLTVTEHALTLVLTLLRRMPAAGQAQAEQRWAAELGGVQPLHPPDAVTSLIGARVLIWGFGNIGQTLAPLLRQLGAEVRGVARTAGQRAGFPVVDEGDLERGLPHTDVLVMILPSADGTRGALSKQRLAVLPPHAYVVNVGRGTTVDEGALVAALDAGEIAGAGLDVTAVEPLPDDSPLWNARNLVLTPHSAGGRPVGADSLISDNVAALLAGEPLRNIIKR
jgi:phosphoglycerate dehydrogenase-like enzyme